MSKSKVVEPDMDKKDVLNRLSELSSDKELVDVTFKVGEEEEEFKAHKLILAMVSEVFRAMLYGPMGNQDIILITDVQPDAFRVLLNYSYKDEASFTNVREALSCMYAARKYLMMKLVKRCITYLNEKKNDLNVCDIYRMAVMLDQVELAGKCEEYVALHLPAVLASPGFLNLNEEIVLKVTEKMSKKIEPVLLFTSLLKWAQYQLYGATDLPENQDLAGLRTLLNPFLPYILFLAMTPLKFYSAISKTGILTDEEIVSLTMALLKVDGRPLPIWCNTEPKMEASASGRSTRTKANAKRTVPYRTRHYSKS